MNHYHNTHSTIWRSLILCLKSDIQQNFIPDVSETNADIFGSLVIQIAVSCNPLLTWINTGAVNNSKQIQHVSEVKNKLYKIIPLFDSIERQTHFKEFIPALDFYIEILNSSKSNVE